MPRSRRSRRGKAGRRDHCAAASVERPAPTGSVEAEVGSNRPTALRLAVSAVSVDVERCHDYPARHRRSVAPDGLSTVLALEVALSGRAAEDTRGDPTPDSRDEPG